MIYLDNASTTKTSDIVNKEMYTFIKSDRSLTLRPENTAGVVRSFIENGMHRLSAPVKLWYKGPMFRYERPQAGRQRQFHQVGVEVFGIKQAAADAEVILMAVDYLKALGLNDLTIELNTLGCPKCREEFKTNLKKVIYPYLSQLCEDCQTRFDKNPLRLLDCKSPECQEIYSKPEIQAIIQGDFMCEECSEHFEELKKYMDTLGIKYERNKLLVRGLDYYNRTVFEIKSNNLGSQNAVCGGGRYDSLVKNLGGEDIPAIGFAMGMERLASLLAEKHEEKITGFVVSNNALEALKLTTELRNNGVTCEFDLTNKKFVKQIEKASKVAKYAIILGDDEIANGTVTVKDLDKGTQETVKREKTISVLSI